MKRNILLVMSMLISLRLFSTPVKSLTSPEQFYGDLVSSIDYIQGKMIVKLGSGRWTSKIGAANVEWNNDNNTLATFAFNYRSGVLQKDSYLAFSPAVHLWVRSTNAQDLSLSIDTIYYNQIGEFKSWGANTHFDNIKDGKRSPINPNKSGEIQTAMALNLRADDFFQGKLFANYSTPQKLTQPSDAGPSSVFIKQIYFLSDEQRPALSFGFKRGATLHFSKKGGNNLFDNSITLSSNRPSSATFDYIKYDFEAKELHGQVSSFDTNVDDGFITTGSNLSLHLLPATQLSFKSLRFDHSADLTSIDCSTGSLDAGVGLGSRVNFSTAVKNPSYIVFGDNSKLHLDGFSFNIQDKKYTDINISGGSNLTVSILDAQLGIGESSWVTLANGQIAANLQGDYNSSSDKPNATVRVTALNTPITGGILKVNSKTNLTINSGSIKSTDLLLQTKLASGFTGTITDLNVSVSEGSEVGLPNGFQLITKGSSSSFVAASPNEPMYLDGNHEYPIATYIAAINFQKFQNSENPVFGLTDGTMN